MLSHFAKRSFYNVAGPLMKVNGWFYRIFRAPTNSGKNAVRLHLGPGQRKYLSGWINIDSNIFTGKCDLWADLRNPLPFGDDTVEAVYSYHMAEHLPDLEGHIKDVFRVLKPGGVYRLGGPNGDSAIRKYLEDDRDWFSEFPDKYDSIGGCVMNFLLCRNEHLAILTESLLVELGARAGFSQFEKLLPVKETKHLELFSNCLATELENDFKVPHTLIIELTK